MAKLPLPDEQPIAVNALRNMRSRIAGEIEMHSREIDRLRAELVHLDATMQCSTPKPTRPMFRANTQSCPAREILKNAEWVLPFGTGVSYCLPPRQARPFHGEIRPSDLSFPWPFQHRGRLFLLSARSGEQSLFDNYQIGQRKQGM